MDAIKARIDVGEGVRIAGRAAKLFAKFLRLGKDGLTKEERLELGADLMSLAGEVLADAAD